MRSSEDYVKLTPRNVGISDFDYRDSYYPKPSASLLFLLRRPFASDLRTGYDKHPNDGSVMTYTGHTVLQTLIRCHFSVNDSFRVASIRHSCIGSPKRQQASNTSTPVRLMDVYTCARPSSLRPSFG